MGHAVPDGSLGPLQLLLKDVSADLLPNHGRRFQMSFFVSPRSKTNLRYQQKTVRKSTQKWVQELNRSDPDQDPTRLSDMLGTSQFPDEPSDEPRPRLGLQQLVSSPRLGEGSV